MTYTDEAVGSIEEWVSIAREQEEDRDDNCIPVFYLEEKFDARRSSEEGRQCYRNVEMVKIIVPGSKDEHVAKVSEEHIRRWPRKYEAWKLKHETQEEGLALENVPFMSPAQVAELKAINIFTAEQLVALPDAHLEKVGMGARALQERVRQYVQPADETETELRKTIAQMERRLETLEEENRLLKLGDEEQPRRRRRKKVETAE